MSGLVLYGGLEQEDLRALTLWRPWDECIVMGPKDIENRTWKPPQSIIGKFIAIHAGQKYDKNAAVEMVEQKLWSPPSPATCPHSVIKGVVRVKDYIQENHPRLGGMTWTGDEAEVMCGEGHPQDPFDVSRCGASASRSDAQSQKPSWRSIVHDDSPWFSGPYGWLLVDVVAFPEPVPAKGAMGLWRVWGELRDRVNEQWRQGLELATVVCIGRGGIGAGRDGCDRFDGDGETGGTCPHCGGMLLSNAVIRAAEAVT